MIKFCTSKGLKVPQGDCETVTVKCGFLVAVTLKYQILIQLVLKCYHKLIKDTYE